MRYLDDRALIRAARAHLLGEMPTPEEGAELLSAGVASPIYAGWTANGNLDLHGVMLLPAARAIVEAVVTLDEALAALQLEVDPDDFEGTTVRLDEPVLVVGEREGGQHLGLLHGAQTGRLEVLDRDSYALTLDVRWDEQPMSTPLDEVHEWLRRRRLRACADVERERYA